MMADTSPWTWDPARQSYYFYDQIAHLYRYQNGETIDSSGRVVQSLQAGAVSASSTVDDVERGAHVDLSAPLSTLSLAGDERTPRSYDLTGPSLVSEGNEFLSYDSRTLYGSSKYPPNSLQESSDPTSGYGYHTGSSTTPSNYGLDFSHAEASMNPGLPADTPQFISPAKLGEKEGWKLRREHFFTIGKVFEAYCKRNAGKHDRKSRSDSKPTRELLLIVAIQDTNPLNCLCVPLSDFKDKERKLSSYNKGQHAVAQTVRKPSSRDKGRNESKSKHDHERPLKDEKGFRMFHLVPSEKRDSENNFWIDFRRNTQFGDRSISIRNFGDIDNCCKEELVRCWAKWLANHGKVSSNQKALVPLKQEEPSDQEEEEPSSAQKESSDRDLGANDSDPEIQPHPAPIPRINCWERCFVPPEVLSQFPNLQSLPRPEPRLGTKDHRIWEKEYREWGHIRCGCGKGYFCREHGDWISGDEVESSIAPGADFQQRGSCPRIHYTDGSERQSYVGKRDARRYHISRDS